MNRPGYEVQVFKSWDELPLMLSVKQAAAVAGYGQAVIRELCRAGKLPHVKWGRAYRIPREKFSEFISKQAAI